VKRLLIIGAWTERSACQNEDPDLFFLKEGEVYKPGRFDEAQRICGGCPVRYDCDTYATRAKEKWGVWAQRDRGEAKHAERAAKAEALLRDIMSVPGDEGEAEVRMALAGPAAGGRPDERSA
jgi:WhiB family redox-sensing transcriptional regulator